MFSSVKNIQERLKRREETPSQESINSGSLSTNGGEMVASGFLCPNCRSSFNEINQLMEHVSQCNMVSEQDETGMGAAQLNSSSSHSSHLNNNNASTTAAPSITSNGYVTSNVTSSSSSTTTAAAASKDHHHESSSNNNSRVSISSNKTRLSPSRNPFSSPSQTSTNGASSSHESAKILQLTQEVVKWKAKCDEQSGWIDSLNQQMKSKEINLQKKSKYIEKLENDILAYEERSDDSVAMKSELNSLQELIANLTSEHETKVNELLDSLHNSEKENSEMKSQIVTKDNLIKDMQYRVEELEKTSKSSPSEVETNEEIGSNLASGDKGESVAVTAVVDSISGHLTEEEREKLDCCKKCQSSDEIIKKLRLDLENVQTSKSSTILALQQQIETMEAKESKGCAQCREYELQSKKEHRSHITEVNSLQNQISSLRSEVTEQSRLKENAESLSLSLNEELKSNKDSIDQLKAQINSLEKSLQSSEKENEALREEINSIKTQDEKNEELNKELERLKTSLDQNAEELNRCKKANEKLQTDLDNLTLQLDKCEKSLFNCQHEKNILEKESSEEKVKLTNQIETLRCNISAVREELSESEAQYEQQMSLLNQNLAMLRTELTGKEEEVAKLETKLVDLQNELKEKIAEANSQKEATDKISEKLQAKNLEFDRLKTHYVEIRASLEGAQRVMFELGREQQSLQVERARMFDRNWLPDHHVSNCLGCNKEFSATIRKHHCRCCGKIFCNDCSSKKASLPAHPTPVRVCTQCCDMLPINPAISTPTANTNS